MHFRDVYTSADDWPHGDFGYFQPPETPECPAPPCPVSPAGTAPPAPWFGGSRAAACAVPLSPPEAVRLDQAWGCAGRWRCPVGGSSALHRVAQVWGGRGLSQPGLALVHRFRNRFCSCPAGAPLPPAVAMVKPQLANQSPAGERAHSRRCDCAGWGLGSEQEGWAGCSLGGVLPSPAASTQQAQGVLARDWATAHTGARVRTGAGVPEQPFGESALGDPPTPTLRESLPPLGPWPRPSSPWGTAPEPSFPCLPLYRELT